MSLIFSNLVVIKTLSSNHRMYNLYAKFVKILEICKQFSENLVNDSGNVPRRGPVPKFSDLEVVALSLTAETESIDSEKWLFDYKLQEYKDSIPNLISRRQFNDRRKKTSGLCEELRKRIAMEMDGGEEQFFVDSKPIEVCRVARGKRLPLAEFFREIANKELECKVSGFSSEARKALLTHSWPGNVRELRQKIMGAVLQAQTGLVTKEHLELGITETTSVTGFSLRNDEEDKERILRALKQADGNRKVAAELLGIGRTTLYNKLEEYGLKYKFEQP